MAKDSSSFRLSATPVSVLAHLLAISIFILILVWTLHFREGLSLTSKNKQKIFNVHPVLMVIGFVLVGGEAIMAHKTVPSTRNGNAPKTIHLILHLIALLLSIVGLYAVFRFHHDLNIPDVYTLHSWLGITTISLYTLQWLLAFFSFSFPRADSSKRSRIKPWHWFSGMVIFIMGICTAETGLVEKFVFLGLRRQQEALIVNFTGLLILLFAITVSLTVILPKSR